MKYFVPAGRITNKGMPQRERKCFVVKKTVWKLFAPALCAAVLFAACSKDDSSSSRPQSVPTPPASSSVPPASASSQPASSSSAASSEAASSVPASSSAASSSAAATPTQSTRRGATVRADGGHPLIRQRKKRKAAHDPRRHAHRVYRLAERVGQNDLRGQNRLCLGSVLIV